MAAASKLLESGKYSAAHFGTVDQGTDVQISSSDAAGLLRRTVRVVAFADEEGVRFQSTFLGSRALVGRTEYV